jgi:hypothetical protein
LKTADYKKPLAQPTGPFSKNVQPFVFGTPLHRRLARKLNVHGHSRNARVKTHRDSQGVIWRGEPYYWCSKGYYRGGQNGPRRPLHELIWENHRRRKVQKSPVKHVVVFLDNNKNNFAPSNLQLRSKAQIANLNQRYISDPEIDSARIVMVCLARAAGCNVSALASMLKRTEDQIRDLERPAAALTAKQRKAVEAIKAKL